VRTILLLLAGVALGVVLTVASVQVAGGWYVYQTAPADACRVMPPGGEIVPHQPNPCHTRSLRWRFLY
jgi:hypothetical protein